MTSSSLRGHAIWAISEMFVSLACLAIMMALAYQSVGALGVGLWSLTTAFTSMLQIGAMRGIG